MGQLTDLQKIALTRCGVLVDVAGHVLAPFELETIQELNRRWQALGSACATTPAEFAIVEDGLRTMETWARGRGHLEADARALPPIGEAA